MIGRWGSLLLFVAIAGVVACGPTPDANAYRAFTDHYAFRITSDPMPPMALEKTVFKVVVRDKKTGQPIQGGEGMLFAETRDGAKAWDSFTPGKELGTYYANLKFVTAETWAMGVEFRSDSTKPLERANWMQDVVPDTSKIP